MVKLGIHVLLVLLLSSRSFASTTDIFDNEKETRRPATPGESIYAIQVGSGCAGVLIAPTIGLSAAHCVRSGTAIRSGVALAKNKPADGKITKTIESGASEGFDIWLFEIEWEQKPHPKGIKIVSHVQIHPDQLAIGERRTADPLFTLGFPRDISNGRLILSWGFGKSDGKDKLIRNNISLINGNSGGGIFKVANKMLVSVVSGGPHMFGQDGWKDNDWEDPAHWNWGPAIWQYYRISKTLQYLYPAPRGISRFYYDRSRN